MEDTMSFKKIQKLLSDKLKKYEKDKDNRIGIFLELESCNDYLLGITKLINYFDNPSKNKTRNDIIEEVEKIVSST